MEINESWESRLLAVEGPGGGGWRRAGKRAEVKREADWLHGRRSISAGGRGPEAGDCKAAEEGWLPEAVHFLIPTLFSFRVGSKPSEWKVRSVGLFGDAVRKGA